MLLTFKSILPLTRTLLLLTFVVSGVGCATSGPEPSAEAQAAAYYGKQPTDQTAAQQLQYFLRKPDFGLKDPESLKIRNVLFGKTWRYFDGNLVYGYLLCAEWDAKNSFGGYGGYEPFGLFMRDNQAYGLTYGRDFRATSACAKVLANPSKYR